MQGTKTWQCENAMKKPFESANGQISEAIVDLPIVSSYYTKIRCNLSRPSAVFLLLYLVLTPFSVCMHQIHLLDRFSNGPSTIDNTFCSIDDTDFCIQEPTVLSSAWYSRKLRSPGVRYEAGLSIHNGNIVWLHGQFQCGAWPDLKVFTSKLVHNLRDNERVVAYNGYRHR